MTEIKSEPASGKQSRHPATPVTAFLLIANLSVYCLMVSGTDGRLSFAADTLLAWGANYPPLTMDGQGWRLFTCIFIHGGVLHAAANLWMLWQFCRLLEYVVGSLSTLVLYLASGLCSSIAALWFHPFGVVQGASGALFGLLGGLFAFLLLKGRTLPEACRRRLYTGCLLFVTINLALGLLVEQIDIVGHTAGLGMGFVIGLLLTSCGFVGIPARSPLRRVILACGTATVLLVVAFQSSPPRPPDIYGEITAFTEVERECLRQYSRARESDDHALGKRIVVDCVDFEILPKWRKAGQRIVQIHRYPSELSEDVQKLRLYIQTRQESWELLVAAVREGNQRKLQAHREKWSQAERLARELSVQ